MTTNTLKIKRKVVKEAINFAGDIEIYQDTTFKKDIKCHNIISKGQRWDINALNIDARDITASNINALDIICEKRIKKSESNKTNARILIQDRSKLEVKEW